MIETSGSRSPRIGSTAKWLAIGCCVVLAAVAGVVVVGRLIGQQAAIKSGFYTEGRRLVGSATFDGPAGAPPSQEYFGFDLGTGVSGWGNNEQQVYTDSTDNARLNGDGMLVIEARRSGGGFTSARLVTRGKAGFTDGLLEARIKMPSGLGLHPAFWLLGSNIEQVGYPGSGEIDVIELVDNGNTYHNAIHGPMTVDPSEKWKQSHDGPFGTDLSADFHVYQAYREDGLIRIGIDGQVVGEYRRDTIPARADWVFDNPMYITLNIAVGGDWPQQVSPETKFPAQMLVDWIKYWK